MTTHRPQSSRYSWFAAIGLACLASTVLIKKAPKTDEKVPEHLRHRADEFQKRCYA